MRGWPDCPDGLSLAERIRWHQGELARLRQLRRDAARALLARRLGDRVVSSAELLARCAADAELADALHQPRTVRRVAEKLARLALEASGAWRVTYRAGGCWTVERHDPSAVQSRPM